MKRLLLTILILILLGGAGTGCASAKKTRSELRGLMLLESLKLKKNRAFYSKHNQKNLRKADRKYRKNTRLRKGAAHPGK